MSGKKLWEGSSQFKENSHLKRYIDWLNTHKKLGFKGYHELWTWSVSHVEDFWESIWQFFEVQSKASYTQVLSSEDMPECKWFDGSKLNYAEHLFRNARANQNAIVFGNESGVRKEISWTELLSQVNSLSNYLRSIGVKKGDRVVAFLPNVPEATISFLAVNAIGAIWSSTSPDFGAESVVDRFAQIKPKVLIAVDGYRYNGKPYGKVDVVKGIVKALPTLEAVVVLPYMSETSMQDFPDDYLNFYNLLDKPSSDFSFEAVDFDHPMWVLYSSGTTGLPKAIVHSHGGILLEHLKYMAFHNDVHAGELFFWFTTTGWMMWNFVQAALLMGSTIVLYDGSPTYPDINALWKFAEELKIHHFGTSAPFLVHNMKNKNRPKSDFDLSTMRSLSSTGAPLPEEAFEYVYDNISSDVWLCSMAGGTDVCTAFVGGTPYYPVHAGEIQCRALGVSLYAYNDKGEAVEDELGEMVIDKPLPSMPIYFWNDPGQKKYLKSYFDYYPGKWRHGDFIKINSKTKGLVIYGRSDATLNRHGIRIGTSEIYRSVGKIDAIDDALIINLEMDEGNHYMPLFVKLKSSAVLTDDLKKAINTQLRKDNSPRHVPDEIIQVNDIPYTISGKKMETPIKKILMGLAVDRSINVDSMRNPESVDFFIEFASKIDKK
ncbi:MAG: acetoacetate--CoA ligase [Bacteroidia bacterium]|nr:acetoacetate--CoA ligase [Bacteroidia bacterium]